MFIIKTNFMRNKAGYTAILVACGWAGAVLEKVIRASGQEPYAQKAQKRLEKKKNSLVSIERNQMNFLFHLNICTK